MNDYEPLKGYENLYAINREGSIVNKHCRVMKFQIDTDGYKKLELHCNGVGKEGKLHRLLAKQFIPNPLNYLTVDHINKNRLDNRLENLRWASHTQQTHNQTNNKKNINIRKTRNGTFEVRFSVNGKEKNFGTYKTLDEALSVRDCALDCEGLLNYCYGLEPVNDYLHS